MPGATAFLCWMFVVLAFAVRTSGEEMLAKGVKQAQFSVIGIEVRTNNAKEASGAGSIPKLWDKFFKDGVLDRIPNKDGFDILVVYSNYRSDRNADYDYLIGARVKDASAIPAGMVAKTVLGGVYTIVTTPSGPVSKVVPETWRRIWEFEDKGQLGAVRAYKTDFEVYDQRSRDPQNSQVDVYIGLK
jgi:predicted transcriptional regulator YdeE